jgi:putative addiction module CopG family antidote
MTIHLDEQRTEPVRRKMETGGYASAEAVVEEAMRLLCDLEADELDRLRQSIAAGMSDIEAGRG